MRVAAGAMALVAVLCMGIAIADMAGGKEVGHRGWLLRAAALLCFVAAVLLNVLAR
jgi:hypothetical protein